MLPTRATLYRDGISESPICSNLCKAEEQTLHHLLINCTLTVDFWILFQDWWYLKTNETITLSTSHILYGWHYMGQSIGKSPKLLFTDSQILHFLHNKPSRRCFRCFCIDHLIGKLEMRLQKKSPSEILSHVGFLLKCQYSANIYGYLISFKKEKISPDSWPQLGLRGWRNFKTHCFISLVRPGNETFRENALQPEEPENVGFSFSCGRKTF